MVKALLLTSIAGLSSMVGFIYTLFKMNKKDENKIIILSLSISLIVMLYLSIFELIPYGFMGINGKIFLTVILIVSGVGIVKLLGQKNDTDLYQIGIFCMISLMLHNIPEGIITFISNIANESIGLKVALGILIHNIPEGICIALPIYYSTKSYFKSFSYTFIAAISEPLGGLLFYLLFKDYINYEIIYYLSIIVGGMMIELSINKILHKCLSYQESNILRRGILIGIGIIILMYIFV